MSDNDGEPLIDHEQDDMEINPKKDATVLQPKPSRSTSQSQSRSRSHSRSRSRSRSSSRSKSRSPVPTRRRYTSRSRSRSRRHRDYSSRSRSASRSRSPIPHRHRSSSTSTIYVENLPYSFTEDTVNSLFGTYGPIRKISLPYDRYSRRIRGYAFIEYEHRRDAEAAYRAFDGHHYEGRKLRCDWDYGPGNNAQKRHRGFQRPPPYYQHPERNFGGYNNRHYAPPPYGGMPPNVYGSGEMMGMYGQQGMYHQPGYYPPPNQQQTSDYYGYERRDIGGNSNTTPNPAPNRRHHNN